MSMKIMKRISVILVVSLLVSLAWKVPAQANYMANDGSIVVDDGRTELGNPGQSYRYGNIYITGQSCVIPAGVTIDCQRLFVCGSLINNGHLKAVEVQCGTYFAPGIYMSGSQSLNVKDWRTDFPYSLGVLTNNGVLEAQLLTVDSSIKVRIPEPAPTIAPTIEPSLAPTIAPTLTPTPSSTPAPTPISTPDYDDDSDEEDDFSPDIVMLIKSIKLKVGEVYNIWNTFGMEGLSGKPSFKSSNKKVATISKGGKIRAKKKGKCKMRIKKGKILRYLTVKVKK